MYEIYFLEVHCINMSRLFEYSVEHVHIDGYQWFKLPQPLQRTSPLQKTSQLQKWWTYKSSSFYTVIEVVTFQSDLPVGSSIGLLLGGVLIGVIFGVGGTCIVFKLHLTKFKKREISEEKQTEKLKVK